MKKNFALIVILCSIIFFSAFLLYKDKMNTAPDTTLILNTIDTNWFFNIKLFYNALHTDKVQAFDFSSTGIVPDDRSYTTYTEGFIPQLRQQKLIDTINTYRLNTKLEPINYFYNYFEFNNVAFVCLADGIEGIYIINLNTYAVQTPHFTTSYGKEKQYVYHLEKGDGVYYMITAKANSQVAYFYILEDTTFNVIKTYKIVPPTDAIYRQHYALDNVGHVFFTDTLGIRVYTDGIDSNFITLPFSPQYITHNTNETLALRLNLETLQYCYWNTDLSALHINELPMPGIRSHLVSAFIEGDYLYLITYDPFHSVYRNYVTLYNLKTNKTIYHVALKKLDSHATLLKADLTVPLSAR